MGAVLQHRDVAAAGPPGAGMTHAWLLPLLQRLKALRPAAGPPGSSSSSRSSSSSSSSRSSGQRRHRLGVRTAHPRLLVVAPSRELVGQVAGEAARLVEGGHLRVLGVAGGTPLLPQVRGAGGEGAVCGAWRRGPHAAGVCCVGRGGALCCMWW
jgi:superfamily II DNA/RNA helicase